MIRFLAGAIAQLLFLGGLMSVVAALASVTQGGAASHWMICAVALLGGGAVVALLERAVDLLEENIKGLEAIFRRLPPSDQER